jgi:hypothetical protein
MGKVAMKVAEDVGLPEVCHSRLQNLIRDIKNLEYVHK